MAIHWIVIFGVATIELKRVEIPAAAFESNISYVRIGQALEFVEKRGKVILGDIFFYGANYGTFFFAYKYQNYTITIPILYLLFIYNVSK